MAYNESWDYIKAIVGVLGYGGAMPTILHFMSDKMFGLFVVTFLYKTPTFELYMVSIVVEIELHAQNTGTTLVFNNE